MNGKTLLASGRGAQARCMTPASAYAAGTDEPRLGAMVAMVAGGRNTDVSAGHLSNGDDAK